MRLIVTRGVGNLGLNPENCKGAEHHHHRRQHRTLSRGALPPRARCDHLRYAPHVSGGAQPAVKSLNYLNNILAKIEAIQAGAGEGLMLNEQGYVAECTGDNIFIVKRGILFTPPISAGGLRGITRDVVFEIAAEFGIPVSEAEPDPVRYFHRGRMFPHRHRGGNHPGESPGQAAHRRRHSRAGDRRFIASFHELTQSTGTPIY